MSKAIARSFLILLPCAKLFDPVALYSNWVIENVVGSGCNCQDVRLIVGGHVVDELLRAEVSLRPDLIESPIVFRTSPPIGHRLSYRSTKARVILLEKSHAAILPPYARLKIQGRLPTETASLRVESCRRHALDAWAGG